MGPLEKALGLLPEPAVFSLGLLLTALIWWVDNRLPTHVSMSVFYLLPIMTVSWFARQRFGLAIALISASAWLQSNPVIIEGRTNWTISVWNTVVRLVFFIVVIYLSRMFLRMRQLRDQEEAARKSAEEAEELKTRLMALVNHEFMNALNSFGMAIGLLQESEPSETAAARKECYQTLNYLFVHLKSATTNFLDSDRVQSGRFVPAPTRTLLRAKLHEVIGVVSPLIENRDVRLKIDFPAHAVTVKIDADALSLVMSNLILNAFKYTPSGGEVGVRITDTGRPEDGVEVSVADTGIGISKEDQRRLFTPYFRTEQGKAIAKGYGIGLSVARELLSSQNIELHLDSEPGKGSRFYFRLPLWQEPAEPRPAAST